MWVMIRNNYITFEVDSLRNKDVRIKKSIFNENSKLKGEIILNIGARVTHMVTYDVDYNEEYIVTV